MLFFYILRNKVVWLLDKVWSEGIVIFYVKGIGLYCLSIECDLMKKFYLKDVFIIFILVNNYYVFFGKVVV